MGTGKDYGERNNYDDNSLILMRQSAEKVDEK